MDIAMVFFKMYCMGLVVVFGQISALIIASAFCGLYNEIPQEFCQSEKFGYLNSLIGRSAFKFQQFHAKVLENVA